MYSDASGHPSTLPVVWPSVRVPRREETMPEMREMNESKATRPSHVDKSRNSPEFPPTYPHWIESNFDKIDSGGVGVPQTSPTPDQPNLNAPDKGAIPMVSAGTDLTDTDRRKLICLEYLALARQDTERATRVRLHYAKLARLNGLTNQQIGDALGITEAAVRAMIARAV